MLQGKNATNCRFFANNVPEYKHKFDMNKTFVDVGIVKKMTENVAKRTVFVGKCMSKTLSYWGFYLK